MDTASSPEELTIDIAIANLQQTNDTSLRYYAAWWLGKFRVNEPAAIAALLEALYDETDRTKAGGYPLRRNAARALGKLENRMAVPMLIEALNCSDYYVREAAAQALEELGDPQAIEPLRQLLHKISDSDSPTPQGMPQPFTAILEALGTLGATEAIAEVKTFANHELPRVQYSAARALYQLTPDPDEAQSYADCLVQALQGDNLQLRRSVLSDLGAIGYFPAAHPIAATFAENSLKLIALKGLLNYQVSSQQLAELSSEAKEIMALMDGLL